MAVLSNTSPTLVDLANMPENGDAADIINQLARFNPMLQDAPAVECNKGTSHLTTIRTGLPTSTWGRLYKGIPQSKSSRQQITDTTSLLEASSQVDTRLIDIVEKAEDKASLRFEEAEGHLEALSQEIATALFYHDTATDPEKPMGFAPRFSQKSGAENSNQIIDGTGTAGLTNTSLWMITWDKKAAHLLYPKGSQAGVKRTDRGQQRVTDANGDPYFVYQEDYQWQVGLTVRDWRYVARLANIGNDLSVDASTGLDLYENMTEMYYRHQGRRVSMGQTYIYCNSTIAKFLDFHARAAGQNSNTLLQLTKSEDGPNAQEVTTFRGVAIRESDALLSTDAQI